MKCFSFDQKSSQGNYLGLALLLILGMNTVAFSGPRLGSYWDGYMEAQKHRMMMRQMEQELKERQWEAVQKRKAWEAEKKRMAEEERQRRAELQAEEQERNYIRSLQQRNINLERNINYFVRGIERKDTRIHALVRTCSEVEGKALALAEKGDLDGALRQMRFVRNWCQRNKSFLQGLYYTGENDFLLMISSKAKYYLNQEYLAKIYAAQ